MKEKSPWKHRLIGAGSALLRGTGGFPFRWIWGGRGIILAFHRVVPSLPAERIWSNAYLEVTTKFLEEVILWFRDRGYAFYSMEDLPGKALKNKQPFVIFTFDDGFRDNLLLALPILQKYRVPMTLYITTDFPDHKAILWWNVVEEVILAREALSFSWSGRPLEYRCSTREEKNETFGKVHSLIQEGTEWSVRERAIEFCRIFGIDPFGSVTSLSLSWDEIREMGKTDGVLLGAHTLSHPVLSQLPEKEASEEICGSKQRIEQETGLTISHFAYPFGGITEAAAREYELAKACGFRTAVTLVSANVFREHKKRLFSLPRIAVGMSMDQGTFDLVRYGFIPMVRNKGRRIN
jgi:peptidoglycan/xylan/chitin deacetylase (PgdA/CDA1 family)